MWSRGAVVARVVTAFALAGAYGCSTRAMPALVDGGGNTGGTMASGAGGGGAGGTMPNIGNGAAGGTMAIDAGGAGGDGGTTPVTCEGATTLLDPGFQATPACAWTLTGGAVIEGTVATNGPDPGQLAFRPPLTGIPCIAGTAVQRLDAPSPAALGPTALVARWRVRDVNAYLGAVLRGHAVTMGQLTINPRPDWRTGRICIGEAAYGAGAEVGIATTQSGTCWKVGEVLVDRVDIVPDTTCPMPGSVLNGDFESEGGWMAGTMDPGTT